MTLKPKLYPDQVIEILKSDDPGKVLAVRYGVDPAVISGIRNGTRYKEIHDAYAGGQYLIGRAEDLLQELPPRSLAGCVTSPPYNKGRIANGAANKWTGNKLGESGYSDHDSVVHDDDMSPAAYIEWQQECIDLMLKATAENGAILYNIAPQHSNGTVDLRQEIIRPFQHYLRQAIVWNRRSSLNTSPLGRFLPPSYEFVYLLAKDEWQIPNSTRKAGNKWGAVWDILPERDNPHPAPFPRELAERMVRLITTGPGTVLDPFAGSGTVPVVCKSMGVRWLAFDLSPQYRNMTLSRLKEKAPAH